MRVATDIRRRLLAKTQIRQSGCWEWCGEISNMGYGRIRMPNGKSGGTNGSAHRVSFEAFKGKIPQEQCVLHRCDNPRCINPHHLFLGTHKDNTQDSIKKGRMPRFRGEEHGSSKLTEDQVCKVWAFTKQGMSQIKMAETFGVHQSSISNVLRRKTWRHIQCA